MNRAQHAVFLLWAFLLLGCKAQYHVDAMNMTEGPIDRARVTFEGGQTFEWGVMDPSVGAGMWPMPGPLGGRALVQWEDADMVAHSNNVALPSGGMWNAITFVIRTGDVVTVETKRK